MQEQLPRTSKEKYHARRCGNRHSKIRRDSDTKQRIKHQRHSSVEFQSSQAAVLLIIPCRLASNVISDIVFTPSFSLIAVLWLQTVL